MAHSSPTSPVRRPSALEMQMGFDAVCMVPVISALVSASATLCGRETSVRTVTAVGLDPPVRESALEVSPAPAPVAVEEPASLAPQGTAHVHVSVDTPAHRANLSALAVSRIHVIAMVHVRQMRVYATHRQRRVTGTVRTAQYAHSDMAVPTVKVSVASSMDPSATTMEAARTEAVVVSQTTVEPPVSYKGMFAMSAPSSGAQTA